MSTVGRIVDNLRKKLLEYENYCFRHAGLLAYMKLGLVAFPQVQCAKSAT